VVGLEITTVPPTPGARFVLDGRAMPTDARGVARGSVVRSSAPHRVELLTPTVEGAGLTSEFERWHGHGDSDQSYTPVLDRVRIDHTVRLRAAFREDRTVGFTVVDQAHHPVDPTRISSVTLRSDTGRTQTLSARDRVQLTVVRPTVADGQVVARESTYSVQSVMVDGANVVNVGEQRFRPSRSGDQVEIVALMRSAHFRVRDRLLGSAIGSVVRLTFPDGRSETHPTDAHGEVVLDNLARGTYRVAAAGQVYDVDQEIALSRSRFVDVSVLTRTDVAILAGCGAAALIVLLLVGRWRIVRHRRARAAATVPPC
jgi:hypothetical protein